MIIDAKNKRDASWYARYGAEPLQNNPMTLVIPLATFAQDLRKRGHL